MAAEYLPRIIVGSGRTYLPGVDLLTAEAVVVGTHVDGVLAVPVVLVVGLSSSRGSMLRSSRNDCGLASPIAALARDPWHPAMRLIVNFTTDILQDMKLSCCYEYVTKLLHICNRQF